MVPKAQASCPRVGEVWLCHTLRAGRKQLLVLPAVGLEVGREAASTGSEAAFREAHESGPGLRALVMALSHSRR